MAYSRLISHFSGRCNSGYRFSLSGGFSFIGSAHRPNILLIKLINISFHICRMILLFNFFSPGKTACIVLSLLFCGLFFSFAEQCFEKAFPLAPDLRIGANILVNFACFIGNDHPALLTKKFEDLIQNIFRWYSDSHCCSLSLNFSNILSAIQFITLKHDAISPGILRPHLPSTHQWGKSPQPS